jgi:hypothetical protein
MSHERDEAMRVQEATEAMIRMREPRSTGPHPDPLDGEIMATLKQVERAFLADVKPSTLTPDGDNVVYHLDGQTVGGALNRVRWLITALEARS